MVYTFSEKKIPFTCKKRVVGINKFLGVNFEPKFDEQFLRIFREVPVEFKPKENSIKIGDKKYFMTSSGNFTSENN